MSGRKIDDAGELLHRPVHPNFIDGDRPSSQAFKPSRSDDGKLSVERGSIITARAAFHLHVDKRGLKAVGVWSVTVGECVEINLPVVADAIPDGGSEPADPAHALVDFTGLGSKRQDAAGRKLADKARARGCQYRPPAATG